MAHVPERFENLSSPEDVVLKLLQQNQQLPFKLDCLLDLSVGLFWCPQISKGFFFPWLDGF